MIIGKDEAIRDAIICVAKLMAASAVTAPKSRGFDDTEIKIVVGDEIKQIAEKIAEIWKVELASGEFWFLGPDAEAVKNSQAIILIGINAKRPPLRLNCGACGYKTCDEYRENVTRGKTSALCAFKLIDLGIAVCSAVGTAQLNHIDNRLMWSVGYAAKQLGLINGDIVLGIPLSATGSNIFFDRYLRYFVDKARAEGRSLQELINEVGIRI